MKQIIARIILFFSGWKILGELDEEMRHSVVVAAPHTSNWDFPIALMAFWRMKLNVKYFIKDDYTKGLFGWFFRWTGAIGVNRGQRNNLIEYAIGLLKDDPTLSVLVTPEGTRSWVPKWKRGFYHIAKGANVPVTLGFVHYGKKRAGILSIVHLTDSFEDDMQKLQDFYNENTEGRYPEKWNPQIY